MYAPLEEVFADICAKHGVIVDLDKVFDAYEIYVREDGSFFKKNRRLAAQDPIKFWSLCNGQMLEFLGVRENTHSLAKRITDEYPSSATIEWRCYPDVPNALAELKQKGLLLGVVSNFEPSLGDILKRLDLAHCLDTVISSEEVGILKPDPQIFHLALREVGVEAGDAIYAGDKYDPDVVGSRSAGLTPVLIDRKQDYGEVDCLKISDLNDLVDLFPSSMD